MLLFPNCKINIGLNIVGRRSDGYHNLETVFYPVHKLHDALEILPQADVAIGKRLLENSQPKEENPQSSRDSQSICFHLSGLTIEGNSANNLCLKAYQLLKQDFPELPPIELALHKAIPMGAGLGGGSADGAFTLQLLNQKFNLNLLHSQLLDYALQLGSDCPFFIINKPCFGYGRGEMLEPMSLNLNGYSIVVIHPGIHVSTAQAFTGITPGPPSVSLQKAIVQPVETWKETLVNDFEKTVFAQYPVLQQIKNRLYETGAVYASMSGSGSAMYGIYEAANMPAAKLYPDYFERHLTL